MQKLLSHFFYSRKVSRQRRFTISCVSELVASGKTIRLDIGAGKMRRQDGWLILDNNGLCDLWWDLTEGIPFPDDSVDEIYSSHVFEHIPPDSLVVLLRECLRVLTPGGSISVCVPNARHFLDAYSQNSFFVDQENDRCWKKGWFDTGSLIDQINYIAYMGGEHRLMFDETNLTAFLRLAGFHHVSVRGFQNGLDLPQRDYESIYAIGYKSA